MYRDKESIVATILERHLQPVTAPADLWYRIQQPSRPNQRGPKRWMTGAFATALCLATLLYGFRLIRHRRFTPVTAVELLSKAPSNLEFRSANASEIREWVKERTGIEVPLSVEHSSKVMLAGARVLAGSAPSAAIAYRVGNHYAMLVVCNNGAAKVNNSERHHSWREERLQGTQVSSWTMRNHSYMLAYNTATGLRDACGVCHSSPDRAMVVN